MVIGHLSNSNLEAAKNIEADRLLFRGEPSFDPLLYLTEELRETFAGPETLRRPPPYAKAPHTRVRGSY